jgi:hypothetical protein
VAKEENKAPSVEELQAKLQEKDAVITALNGLVRYWSSKVVDSESNAVLAQMQQAAQQPSEQGEIPAETEEK